MDFAFAREENENPCVRVPLDTGARVRRSGSMLRIQQGLRFDFCPEYANSSTVFLLRLAIQLRQPHVRAGSEVRPAHLAVHLR